MYDDVPLSSATRLAKAWAANFLGWVTIIFTYLKNKPSKCRLIRVSLKSITYLSWAANWSNKNCGTWVLLPQPVEPETTVTQCASILAKRSFAHLKTGKDRRLISAERSMSNLALQKKIVRSSSHIFYFQWNYLRLSGGFLDEMVALCTLEFPIVSTSNWDKAEGKIPLWVSSIWACPCAILSRSCRWIAK